MSGKTHIPNSYQTPNFIVDRLMQYLIPGEVVVLQFIVRHTLGWQNRAETRSGHISLSVFENGFTTQDGKRFGGCGLDRKTIVAALNALEEFGIIQRPDGHTRNGTQITLVLDEDAIDWSALQSRAETRAARNRKRASKAATSSAEGAVHADADGGGTNPPVELIHQWNNSTSGTIPPVEQFHQWNNSTTTGGTNPPILVEPIHPYKHIKHIKHTPPPTPPTGGDTTVLEPSTDHGTESAMADGASSVPARKEHSSDADTGADTGLFEHIRDVLVERVWGGNQRMLDEASETAKMLLGISERPPYSEHNLPRAAVRDEFDAWVRWWMSKRLHFPRDPGRLAKAWYDFRADTEAQQELAAQRMERRANEQNSYAQVMARVLEAVRRYHEGETG